MINKILQDKFLRHNFIFFCGSMIVAISNYLYHPILSRMMDIESFGEVQALIFLFLLFSMVIGVFRTIVVNIVANAQEIQEKYDIAKSGDAGYGYVGPLTRAKINSL